MAFGWLIAAVIMPSPSSACTWALAAFNIAVYTLLPFRLEVRCVATRSTGRERSRHRTLGGSASDWLVAGGLVAALGHPHHRRSFSRWTILASLCLGAPQTRRHRAVAIGKVIVPGVSPTRSHYGANIVSALLSRDFDAAPARPSELAATRQSSFGPGCGIITRRKCQAYLRPGRPRRRCRFDVHSNEQLQPDPDEWGGYHPAAFAVSRWSIIEHTKQMLAGMSPPASRQRRGIPGYPPAPAIVFARMAGSGDQNVPPPRHADSRTGRTSCTKPGIDELLQRSGALLGVADHRRCRRPAALL